MNETQMLMNLYFILMTKIAYKKLKFKKVCLLQVTEVDGPSHNTVKV